MAGAFTAVDLSRLPCPDAVEVLDYEVILSAMLTDLRSRSLAFNALVESDPAYKILEVAAYRELLLRQRVNEAVKAVTLAYAEGADLEQIAARFNVKRQIITPQDLTVIPSVEEIREDDESLRRRVQLSFEGFSTAGPAGAYIFHALGADPRVRDISVYGPPETPGVVKVAVLAREGDGTAPVDLLRAVEKVLSGEDVRPLTDQVHIQSARILPYKVSAKISVHEGPDPDVVMQVARNKFAAYIDQQHHMGLDVTLSGLYAALHQEGVQNVVLTAPSANIIAAWDEAPYCTGIDLVYGEVDA